jgi:hypothetical protein
MLHIEGDDSAWEQLTLAHKNGREIAVVGKNPVIEGQLDADELQEFIEEVRHYKPESASTWLQQYLPTVKVIYAFQLLSGTDEDDGWTQAASFKLMAKASATRRDSQFCGSLEKASPDIGTWAGTEAGCTLKWTWETNSIGRHSGAAKYPMG